MKILVVDDSPVMRTLLEDVLVTTGYSVTTAANGVEAMEAITKAFTTSFSSTSTCEPQRATGLPHDSERPNFRDLPIIMLTPAARNRINTGEWRRARPPTSQNRSTGKT